ERPHYDVPERQGRQGEGDMSEQDEVKELRAQLTAFMKQQTSEGAAKELELRLENLRLEAEARKLDLELRQQTKESNARALEANVRLDAANKDHEGRDIERYALLKQDVESVLAHRAVLEAHVKRFEKHIDWFEKRVEQAERDATY